MIDVLKGLMNKVLRHGNIIPQKKKNCSPGNCIFRTKSGRLAQSLKKIKEKRYCCPAVMRYL